ncbi:hypothetical protein JTB14_034871 [Gonioctena quinquepunctata]|nr:hypothetical protein JTB14_034871 [Gonioctena quinquepunctata]
MDLLERKCLNGIRETIREYAGYEKLSEEKADTVAVNRKGDIVGYRPPRCQTGQDDESDNNQVSRNNRTHENHRRAPAGKMISKLTLERVVIESILRYIKKQIDINSDIKNIRRTGEEDLMFEKSGDRGEADRLKK